MTRAHVTALTLVNWKGVFYERYRLDRHVTALEGANGAGKTTVMIAAYVVLLPDMSRLRFTNLGESGASGGDRGIWGRLGEPGRPAYTALDLSLPDGRRAIAAVMLQRLGEPSVEATAFLIDEIAAELPLSELFLLRNADSDQVCELDEVKAAVRRAGARIEVFRTIKDYFSALFERGITPLRLGNDEERNKLNEMLRTSMTGGISRVLTSELRGFLLKEESGLGDVLGRMRANLDACRRTRTEVAEARVVERDVSGVYEAGQAMFSCALHATRSAHEAATRAAALARANTLDASRALAELTRQAAELTSREETLESQLTAASRQRAQAVADTERLHTAAQLSQRLGVLEAERQLLEQSAHDATRTQLAATGEQNTRRQQREHMQAAYQGAALGLAHLQHGLDELHRRAHAQRQFERALVQARAALQQPELALDAVATTLASLLARRPNLLAERSQRERERDSAHSRGEEQRNALAALTRLEASAGLAADSTQSEIEPLLRARRALSRLVDHETELSQLPLLRQQHSELAQRAQRQQIAHADARLLGVACGPGAGAELERRSAACEHELNVAQANEQLATAQLTAARLSHSQSQERAATLQAQQLHYQTLRSAAERASDALAETLESAEDIARARDNLAEALAAVTARRKQLTEERETCLRLATELDGPGAALDPELMRLRDELGAELLLAQFDNVPATQAAELEARLGPLLHALVVPDPAAAAATLCDRPRTLDTLWLVRAGADPAGTAATTHGSDVIVEERCAVRVTRRPQRPSLGASARAARALELRERATELSLELEALLLRARQLAGARRDLDQLASQLAVFCQGDPAPALVALVLEQAQLVAAEGAAHEQLHAERERLTSLRSEQAQLAKLLGERNLLEAPDLSVQLATLTQRIAAAQPLQAELTQVAVDRSTLCDLLEVLRQPRTEHHDPEAASARIRELDAQLVRDYQAVSALEDVLQHQHAAGWQDAALTLSSQAALVPALEAQHDSARAALVAADQAVIEGDAAWDAATRAAQTAAAQHSAALAQSERLSAELEALGGAPDVTAAARASEELSHAGERVAELERSVRQLVAESARLRERARQAQQQLQQLEASASAAEQAAIPVEHAWQQWRARVEAAGLVADQPATPSHSHELAAHAGSSRGLLIDRLARSRGSDDTARQIREANGVCAMLDGWLLAREWLRRRVPAQIATDGDPLLALERLRDHLDVLETRLARQETDLRGASEDVARGIDVQVRRARGQVRRLNTQLEGVRFGSIAAIRVEMRRIDRMEQILRALREGEAQELLFLPSLPIDEALEEIFRRYGGGRGGGQRLLDYREYVELVVEIKRQAGEHWEPASPTRLSTGEAIGVGAALMMVVLTEWERDSNLLRAHEQRGSLRFLFLDEANRLSRDNLGVLFDLCKQLDLQLLIAAPEVARAEGNTTYRLVRHIGDDGREEVIVSGRRAVATQPDALTSTPTLPDAPAATE